MNRVILKKLNPTDVIHPSDKAVISKLNKIPGFKKILNDTFGNLTGALKKVTYTGDGYSINKESNPKLYKQFVEDCNILGLTDIPQFTAEWQYFISSFAVGGDEPRIVVTSGSMDLLTEDELNFILGHEIGHILCGHMPYHMFLEALYMPIIGGEYGLMSWASIVKLPLLDWYRISHYSADRMGLLCCQDINVALSAMIKMSGLPKSLYDKIDIKAFIQQAEEFDQNYNNLTNKVVKNLLIRTASSPWLVVRAKELLDWYKSGEYKKIIDNR